jgi:uncharacterized protein (TIGR01319 family)
VWTQKFADPTPHTEAVLLIDFGSTYTKLTAVEAESGRLLGTAQHPTTIDTDLLRGYEAAREKLGHLLNDAAFTETLACSSAGGGLRLAIIGLEPELTVEAARRAALNAGARVVGAISRGLTSENLVKLVEARPDIVLLAGGTNGGNASVFIESARALADSSIDVPIVLAGNEEAQPIASDLLRAGGKRGVATPNLMPEVGVIHESAVREAIRALFISHVIGGKHLSSRAEFASMVLMATPDAVLTATELLAAGVGKEPGFGDLMVIDLGGATTDVHSVVHAEPQAGYVQELLPIPHASRTVEADLGLRWSALAILEAAAAEMPSRDVSHLWAGAELRAANPGFVAQSMTEMKADLELAGCAIEIAVRRHAGRLTIELSPQGAALRKSGRDLRAISTVVVSGGIFRHAAPDQLTILLPEVAGARELMLPRHPRFAVDRAYVLAAAGLLATRNRPAAFALMNQELMHLPHPSGEGSPCSASN